MMLICWLIGHRYDYDIRKPEWVALVCTRCGKIVTLEETRNETSSGVSVREVNQKGQSIVEYAVMLAILLLVVIGTIHLIGTNTNQMFSSVASSMQ
jgi:Flp pilus assembly pilin Flp